MHPKGRRATHTFEGEAKGLCPSSGTGEVEESRALRRRGPEWVGERRREVWQALHQEPDQHSDIGQRHKDGGAGRETQPVQGIEHDLDGE